jgi:hypothetical protein
MTPPCVPPFPLFASGRLFASASKAPAETRRSWVATGVLLGLAGAGVAVVHSAAEAPAGAAREHRIRQPAAPRAGAPGAHRTSLNPLPVHAAAASTAVEPKEPDLWDRWAQVKAFLSGWKQHAQPSQLPMDKLKCHMPPGGERSRRAPAATQCVLHRGVLRASCAMAPAVLRRPLRAPSAACGTPLTHSASPFLLTRAS